MVLPKSGKRLSLPTPKDFFVCPPLNPIEGNLFIQKARSGLEELVFECQLSDNFDTPIRWKYETESSEGVKLYNGHDSNAPSNTNTILGVTTLRASIDEVPQMLRLDSHGKYLDLCSNYHLDVLDCASLYTLLDDVSDPQKEYIGIKWEALQSPVPGIMRPRDSCVVECFRGFTQDGKRGYSRSVESIGIPSCPDLSDTFGLVRMHIFRKGYVFRETDEPGVLQIMYMLQVDLRGVVPAWMIRLLIRGRAKTIGAMDQYFRQHRMNRALNPDAVIPASKRSRCSICQTKLNGRPTRFNCSVCGDVTCVNCQRVWYIQDRYRKASVCNQCSIEPKDSNRMSLTSKSGTNLTCSTEFDEEGSISQLSDTIDVYSALDTIVMESIRGEKVTQPNVHESLRVRRRESAPLSTKMDVASSRLRPPSTSAPTRVQIYTPLPTETQGRSREPSQIQGAGPEVKQLLQQLKELGFDESVLAHYESTRFCG